MKALSILFAFFPLIHLLMIGWGGYHFFHHASLCSFILLIFIIYVIPPLKWRVVAKMFPPKKGVSYVGKNATKENSWIISYHLQQVYNAIPMIENTLKIIPGLYSLWLRLWGARIGKKVNWTAQSINVDRPFIHIGDRTLIGNQSYLSAHAIKKKDDRYILYLQDVIIENDVVIAVQVLIGPGVHIHNKAFVSARAGVRPGTKISEGEIYEKFS
jgi:acetyltransferase-like isoleucine patch superfamily enzyme